MAQASVQFEIETLGFDKLINKDLFALMQAFSFRQKKRIMKKAAAYMKTEIRKNITAGGRKEEQRGTWEKLKTNRSPHGKKGGKALRGKFRTIVTTWFSGDAIAVGVRSPIAEYHQSGYQAGRRRLPARPFVMIHNHNVETVAEMLKVHIEREALRDIR